MITDFWMGFIVGFGQAVAACIVLAALLYGRGVLRSCQDRRIIEQAIAISRERPWP